jgi:hypothetical protein
MDAYNEGYVAFASSFSMPEPHHIILFLNLTLNKQGPRAEPHHYGVAPKHCF